MIKNKGYITCKEAASILGVSSAYIRMLIGDKRLKAEKLGNNWLLKFNDIIKFNIKRINGDQNKWKQLMNHQKK